MTSVLSMAVSYETILRDVNEDTKTTASTVSSSIDAQPRKHLDGRRRTSSFEPSLVIFDKDGTLIDFKHMWGDWAENLCRKMEALEVHQESVQDVASALGFNRETKEVHKTSPICCTPMHKISEICENTLRKHFEEELAKSILRQVWHMPDPLLTSKPLTDLPLLFKYMREELNLKIAVCTTDNRDVTETTLKMFEVHHYVDLIVCGDDLFLPPKPSPEQIFYICSTLGVLPENTIMVGDTLTDMKMGAEAKVGRNVAILNGAGSVEDLSLAADFILPSMDKFMKVLN